MEIENCKKSELRDVVITVRVTKSMSKFLKDNKLSPSMIMLNAIEDLGYDKK